MTVTNVTAKNCRSYVVYYMPLAFNCWASCMTDFEATASTKTPPASQLYDFEEDDNILNSHNSSIDYMFDYDNRTINQYIDYLFEDGNQDITSSFDLRNNSFLDTNSTVNNININNYYNSSFEDVKSLDRSTPSTSITVMATFFGVVTIIAIVVCVIFRRSFQWQPVATEPVNIHPIANSSVISFEIRRGIRDVLRLVEITKWSSFCPVITNNRVLK